jgi:hypothetical protein
MWNSRVTGLVFAVAQFVWPLHAQSHTVKLNGGLEAEVISIGRSADHVSLNISMNIANKGSSTAYLLLVGNPVVNDNTGGTFNSFHGVSGLASCGWAFDACIGVPRERDNMTVALDHFTMIDPGVEIVVNMRFSSNGSKGPLITFSADLAYRLGDQTKDANIPDTDKRKQIRRMTLSFPPMSVTEAK